VDKILSKILYCWFSNTYRAKKVLCSATLQYSFFHRKKLKKCCFKRRTFFETHSFVLNF